MTTITKNLPWFIKDLGVSIVGEECYVNLVENLDVGDVKCLKYTLSKGLGIGIVVGGSIMKVPQILLITNAGSARGLSFPAYVLETLSYAITLAYSFRHHFPFSTYGENFFLTIQNVVITFLILLYSPARSGSSKILPTLLGTVASGAALYAVPLSTLSFLQMTTLPLSLFSKLPQIRQNARSQSTGQLSAFAVISQILGCLARLFTTATEVGDSLVFAGFALALILNIVLGVQLYLYWGQSIADIEEPISLKDFRDEKKESYSAFREPSAQPSGYTTPAHRISTPPPRTPSSAGGKKWSRKVD